MAIPVKLDEIIVGLEAQSDESHAFLDKRTGEVVLIRDEQMRAAEDLIKGSGAFRRFKDAVHHYGIADDWHKYRDDALKQIAIEWCRENNVEFSDQ